MPGAARTTIDNSTIATEKYGRKDKPLVKSRVSTDSAALSQRPPFEFSSSRMPISIEHCGCSSALRFIKRKVYSGQNFFELNGQPVACADSRDANRHVLRD
jgi:hypothetical protein